jgi:hypothetical protein
MSQRASHWASEPARGAWVGASEQAAAGPIGTAQGHHTHECHLTLSGLHVQCAGCYCGLCAYCVAHACTGPPHTAVLIRLPLPRSPCVHVHVHVHACRWCLWICTWLTWRRRPTESAPWTRRWLSTTRRYRPQWRDGGLNPWSVSMAMAQHAACSIHADHRGGGARLPPLPGC